MLLNTAERVCEVENDHETHKATIRADGQMFSILYSHIYTQKEWAIVREYVANAIDAHRAAGVLTEPIKLHLPSIIEPWFEVTDWGTGMSPEEIHLRMDYGDSTKRQNVHDIGGFGIGLKVAFCYTDQFTLTTRWQGRQYTFQAYLDDEGIPNTTLLHDEETNESNGVTIRVPIKDSSYTTNQEFCEAARRLWRYLPVEPRCNQPINRDGEHSPEYLVDLVPEVSPGRPLERVALDQAKAPRTLTIVQGIVPYDVGYSTVVDMLNSHGRRHVSGQLERITTRAGLVLWTRINTPPVAVSRETLQLNPNDKALIAELVEVAVEAIATEYKKRLTSRRATWFAWAQAADAIGLQIAPEDVPQPFRDITLDGKGLSLRPEFLGAEEDTIAFVEYDHSHRRQSSHRKSYLTAVASGRFTNAIVFVQKAARTPHKYFLDEIFYAEPNNRMTQAILVVGDYRDVAVKAETLGLPCEVRELPIHKAAPGSQQAAHRKLGKRKYSSPHAKIDRTTEGAWRTDIQWHKHIAADYLERIDEWQQDEHLVIVLSRDDWHRLPLQHVGEFLRAGLIRPREPTDQVHVTYLDVDRNHSRVYEHVEKETRHLRRPFAKLIHAVNPDAPFVPDPQALAWHKAIVTTVMDEEWWQGLPRDANEAGRLIPALARFDNDPVLKGYARNWGRLTRYGRCIRRHEPRASDRITTLVGNPAFPGLKTTYQLTPPDPQLVARLYCLRAGALAARAAIHKDRPALAHLLQMAARHPRTLADQYNAALLELLTINPEDHAPCNTS